MQYWSGRATNLCITQVCCPPRPTVCNVIHAHRYHEESVSQNQNTGEIALIAEKHINGRIISGKIQTKNVWTTATAKDRGYIEVRATMPAKVSLI